MDLTIEEGETKEEFTKRKKGGKKKIFPEGKLHCTQSFRKVDKEWVFEEIDGGNVACIKNQFNR